MPVTSFDAAGGRRSAGRAALLRYLSAAGVTARKLARVCRCSPATLSAIRSGERAPSLGVAVAMEHAIGIRPAAWLAPESDCESVDVQQSESESGHTQDVSGASAA